MFWGSGQVGEVWWHVHHTRLLETLTEPVKNRQEYILTAKPEDERDTRMRFLTPVRGRLPEKVLIALVNEARAMAEWLAADVALRSLRGGASQQAQYASYSYATDPLFSGPVGQSHALWSAIMEAEALREKSRYRAYEAEDARARVMKDPDVKCKLEALHKLEHGDRCPWNGSTLFPSKASGTYVHPAASPLSAAQATFFAPSLAPFFDPTATKKSVTPKK